jgi:hypothetical protein
MFKSTIYTILALAMALTTFAAPTLIPDAQLIKKDLVGHLVLRHVYDIVWLTMHQIDWGETGGLGTGGEILKKE